MFVQLDDDEVIDSGSNNVGPKRNLRSDSRQAANRNEWGVQSELAEQFGGRVDIVDAFVREGKLQLQGAGVCGSKVRRISAIPK